MKTGAYVLITPARNEESYIEATLQSIVSQTLLPRKWIIVSDGSTDRTDEIVRHYAELHHFIDFVRREVQGRRNFASKVHAFKCGLAQLDCLDYGFVGNQDADSSCPRDYYERVLRMFLGNPRLGIGGGVCHEYIDGRWIPHQTNTSWSVVGGIQMFRRECYEQIGGYLPLCQGGVDTTAEIMARMHGWEVRANPALVVLHHRRMGCGNGGIWKARFNEGRQEYLLGYLLGYELLKQVYKVTERPYLFGSLIRLVGYLTLWIVQARNCLPENAERFFKEEQKARMLTFLSKVVTKHKTGIKSH